jgi:hypothetical protein
VHPLFMSNMATTAPTADTVVPAGRAGEAVCPVDGTAGPDGTVIPQGPPGTGPHNGEVAGMGDGTSPIGEKVRGLARTGLMAPNTITGTTPHQVHVVRRVAIQLRNMFL